MPNLGCTHQIVTLHSNSGQSTNWFVFMEIVFVYLLYLVLISLAYGSLCRHESYSNQYPGQGAPPGGSYPNQQPGMYPQQQSVRKRLIKRSDVFFLYDIGIMTKCY